MTALVVLGKDIQKIQDVLRNYFEKKMASPDAIAIDWVSLPSYLQEPFFEMCLAYMERLAEKEAFTSGTLAIYSDIAKDMVAAAKKE